MVSINKILEGDKLSLPKVDDRARNLIIKVENKKVIIKIDPKEASDLYLTKDQAIKCAHLLLARARLIDK